METKIAKIQIESDLKTLLDDIRSGVEWKFYAPLRDKLIEKIKKYKLEIWAIERLREMTK